MSSKFIPANRGFINLAAVFYLIERGGGWEVVRGGSKPHNRENEMISLDNIQNWIAQMPAGWVQVFTLDTSHLLINLNQCAQVYSLGPDPKKGFNHRFEPKNVYYGQYRYEDDLTIRTKEESLVDLVSSSDAPVAKRVKWGMKELERERS